MPLPAVIREIQTIYCTCTRVPYSTVSAHAYPSDATPDASLQASSSRLKIIRQSVRFRTISVIPKQTRTIPIGGKQYPNTASLSWPPSVLVFLSALILFDSESRSRHGVGPSCACPHSPRGERCATSNGCTPATSSEDRRQMEGEKVIHNGYYSIIRASKTSVTSARGS